MQTLTQRDRHSGTTTHPHPLTHRVTQPQNQTDTDTEPHTETHTQIHTQTDRHSDRHSEIWEMYDVMMNIGQILDITKLFDLHRQVLCEPKEPVSIRPCNQCSICIFSLRSVLGIMDLGKRNFPGLSKYTINTSKWSQTMIK